MFVKPEGLLGEIIFKFCDLHISLKLPFIGGYKFDSFVWLYL